MPLEKLDRDDCLALLAQHNLGRLAVTIAQQPLIFPVCYALDRDEIVFRTDPGTKLYGAHHQDVAFEIDGIDAVGCDHRGWSVLVVGRAELVENASDTRRLETLYLGPWSSGPKAHWVCIRGGAITGRVISFVDDAIE
jgi:nitroimidazol reductase NimA-like FMN-containing flavoprotein (pyridoxamine 5'-phosphate oxidase superfamily)